MDKISKITLFLCLALLFFACSKKDSPVVAVVGDINITQDDILTEMKIQSTKYDSDILSSPDNFNTFRKNTMNLLLEESILLNEAKKLNLELDERSLEKLIASAETIFNSETHKELLEKNKISRSKWIDAQKKRVVIQELIKTEVADKIPISDKEIKAYYSKHVSDFRQPTQFRAKQIIVDNREFAEELLLKLKNGKNFDELAKKHSLSPDGKRGGDLGYFNSNTYPEIFTQICENLQIGEISGAIETEYGYQIFQLIDKRPARQKSLAEVKDRIRLSISETKTKDVYDKWFDELKKNTPVLVQKEKLEEVKFE